MDVSTWIEAGADQAARLVDAAKTAGLAAAVPTCPGWAMRDLLLHTGGVHRWAATIVGEARSEPLGLAEPQDIVATLPTDAALIDWYADSHAMLVAALRAAPADLACWTFMRTTPNSLGFWARRQAHEVTIHRIDAESAAGRRTAVDPELAADGIDELLTGFLPRNRKLRTEAEHRVLISADDAGRHWLAQVGPDRPRASEISAPEPADTSISGAAAELYLALWNRASWDGLTVRGDADLQRRWAESVQVRWS